jgi:tRNA dimethylallyltransferase
LAASASNKIIIIAGPTAVGKTSVAIEVARYFNTEIISADSRQCYKELNIGVARPSEKELSAVKHYFIGSHSIHDKVTASTFEAYALDKVNQIFAQNRTAVMTGGTGLYIKAFCEGMDAIPQIPESIRREVISGYEQNGLSWLQGEIKNSDPDFFQSGEMENPQRLMRALEVIRSTGKSITDYWRRRPVGRDFEVVKIGLELPKDQLHSNIHSRVEKMIEQGLLEEVRSLIPYQHLNALQTVGYREFFAHYNGEASISEAVDLVKRNTRQYAKRQMTWFRKDKAFHWMRPDTDAVLAFLETHGFPRPEHKI